MRWCGFAEVLFLFGFAINGAWCLRIIIEFHSSNEIQTASASVEKDAAPCARNVKARRWLAESSIFKGIVLDVHPHDHNDAPDLEDCLKLVIPGLAMVWRLPSDRNPAIQNAQRSRPGTFNRQSALDEASVKQLPPRHPSAAKVSDSVHVTPRILHELTGVDKLHARGITGQGVTVAVLDLGYDYLHPAFRGSLGNESTLQYGVDLVGDGFDPVLTKPLWSPNAFTECRAHGTHVSALIAGRHEEVGFQGVAPDVNFEHYRISGCGYHLLDDEVVIEALLLAHSRSVDVISISFANMRGPFSNELVSEILRRIQKEDRIICVVAAGNDGRAGPFSAVSPSGAPGIISTGAVNSVHVVRSNPRARAAYAVGDKEHFFDFEWTPAAPSRFAESLPLCILSMNTSVSDDACGKAISYTQMGLRFRTCIVLIRRGGCSITEKLAYVAAQGATYALIYDNTIGEGWDLFAYNNTVLGISGAGSLLAASGERLVSLVANGADLRMEMDSNFTLLPYVRVRENPLHPPGTIYIGGSWGPSGDLSGFPSLLGPGGSIWSAVPRSHGGYATHSGTSLSAPYIAGCAALLRSAKPLYTASEIRRLLIHTATPLLFSNGTGTLKDTLAPTWQQGGGLVNPLLALESQTKLSADFLSFNDTEFFQNLTFTIVNEDQREATYSISSIAAATVATFSSGARTISVLSEENDIVSPQFLAGVDSTRAAIIAFNTTTLTVAPGASASVHVSADISHVINERTCPLYSGYITITKNLGERLSLPYGGVGCRTRDIPVLPPNWNATLLAAATYNESRKETLTPIEPNTTFKLPLPTSSAMPDFKLAVKFPTIYVQLAMISPGVEIFARQCENAAEYSRISADPDSKKPGGYSRVVPSPIMWQGLLQNGSVAASGCYTLKICAFRLWGTERDCIVTTQFNILYD